MPINESNSEAEIITIVMKTPLSMNGSSKKKESTYLAIPEKTKLNVKKIL